MSVEIPAIPDEFFEQAAQPPKKEVFEPKDPAEKIKYHHKCKTKNCSDYVDQRTGIKGYEWYSFNEFPRACPRCKNYSWFKGTRPRKSKSLGIELKK